jgi:general secretion pathway protein H
VLDIDKHTVWLEEAQSSRALRVNLSDEGSRDKAIRRNEEQRLKDVKAEAEADAERLAEGTTLKHAGFSPVKGVELAGEKVGQPRELGSSVEFRQIAIEHDGEPHTKGRAFLYFWPGGETEWASIQLRKAGDKDGLTVMVSPLTGRAKIERGSVDLPKAKKDGDIDESEGET